MAEIKVLIEGIHKFLDEGKLRICSTVTLIKSDKNILVDTGSFLDKDKLIEGLKKEGLTVEEIDIVILTHLHLDHLINIYLFKNAKIFCKFNGKSSGQFHIPSEECLKRTEIEDNIKIAKDVEFLLTPGHTPDSISVVVNTNKGKVVIAGDAFPKEEFVDLEGEKMGPYEKGQIANLPKEIINILVDDKKVERIE